MRNNLFTSNSKRIKRIAKSVIFIILLLTTLLFVARPLAFKEPDGNTTWKVFYEMEKNTLDVLVIGSSRAYVNINPVVMYDTEGIAAFNLCGSMQPMWNSYYYFKEALKYQKPKLLVLDGFFVTEAQEYADAPRIIKNNYGLKWSFLKVQSIMTSAPKEAWGDYLIEFIQTHDRYESLVEKDFTDKGWYPQGKTWRGQADNFATEIQTAPMEEKVEAKAKLPAKSEEYYRKILQLAKDEGIPVCVVITPYQDIEGYDTEKFNTAADIAAEYGAEFVDFSYRYDMLGLDLATDYADVVHMNYKGNEKFSTYLANYLAEAYDLPDRRGDSAYADWETESAVRARRIYNNEIKNVQSVEDYKMLLSDSTKNNDYIYMYNYVSYNSILRAYAYEGNTMVYSSDEHKNGFYLYPDKYNCLRIDGFLSMYYNNSNCSQTSNGYNIVVYDKVTDSIVDIVGIELDDKGQIKDTLVR